MPKTDRRTARPPATRLPRPTALPLLVLGGLLCGLVLPGCSIPAKFHSAARMERGLLLVLPGIEGRSILNRNLAYGLYEGGVRSAIEVYDWTTPIPGAFVFNLANLSRNERKAREIAARIESYQKRYPGRPVHMVGHSGGGGIAVLALEALPRESRIDMAILLGPALSQTYDLSRALRRTQHGIVNLYSAEDVALLRVGTSVAGTIDREHGASAGALGFKAPPGLSTADRRLYKDLLRQVGWTERLERYGANGSHIGWTTRRFARRYLAELVRRNETHSAEVRNAENPAIQPGPPHYGSEPVQPQPAPESPPPPSTSEPGSANAPDGSRGAPPERE